MNVNELLYVQQGEKPLDRLAVNGGFAAIFKTIGVVGDSLASGCLEYRKEDGSFGCVEDPFYSWPEYIARNTGATIRRFSQTGMTAHHYVNTWAEQNGYWNPDLACQAYIIALGVNDIFSHMKEVGSVSDLNAENPANSKDTFAGYYGRIILRLKEIQPKAKFFLVAMPREGDHNDVKRKAHRDLLAEFAKAISNVYLIDLYTYGPEFNKEFMDVFEPGHLSPAGYLLSARMIESYIDYIVRANHDDFREVGFIGTGYSYYPEK